MNERSKAFLALLLFGALLFGTFSSESQAQDYQGPWYVRADLQGVLSRTSGSVERESLLNFGFFMRADYLERAGVTVGYNRTILGLKGGIEDINQDNIFLSGQWNMTPDWAAGRITFRLDGLLVSNDDPSNGSGVDIVAPLLSYTSHSKAFYADLGYARSAYDDSVLIADDLQVNQLTPTLGFGFNKQRDWLQLRAYLIDVSSAERSQGLDQTAALEVKWTHSFASRKFSGLQALRVSVLAGERIFAVDPDAALVYNLVDVQTGGVAFGGEWSLGDRTKLLILFGAEQYENRTINDDYANLFIYFDLAHRWY